MPVSDSKKPGGPPPDDFSKTTPNVSLPDDTPGRGDWDKTNYKFPRQPPSDDWGKTVANIKPIDTSGEDFGKTYFPGAKAPSTPEWGMTEARVNVAGADFGTRPEDFGGNSQGQVYEKTTPYFRLPEAERAKYQDLPPTPTEQAAQEEQERQEKGGIPGWFWVLAGLLVMFFFAIIVLGIVYFLIIRGSGYEVSLKGAPPGSSIKINGSQWGVTDADETIKLPNLKEGETKKIDIVNELWDCQQLEVRSQNGVVTSNGVALVKNQLLAKCSQKKITITDIGGNGDCSPGSFKPGEFDKAEKCYVKALQELPDPFTPEQLVNALSILIINFESGKFDVPSARLSALQMGADYIKKLQQRDPTIILEVGGHTDSDGDNSSNQRLSENRADAVKKILVRFGVNATGLQTRGYGEENPTYDNGTDDGKFLNRRIGYLIVRTK